MTRQRDPRYSTARWRRLRAQVIRRDGRQCAIPGCRTDMTQRFATHVDHIHEVSDGASFWNLDNLQVLCRKHHGAKTYNVSAHRDNGPTSPNA